MELTKEYFDKSLENLTKHVDKRFEAVNEKFETIDERFDAVDERFNTVNEKFDGVNVRLNAVDEKFESIDGRLEGLNQKINTQTVELKQYVHEAFEVQQTWMESRFNELIENSNLQKKVNQIENVVRKLATKVGMHY